MTKRSCYFCTVPYGFLYVVNGHPLYQYGREIIRLGASRMAKRRWGGGAVGPWGRGAVGPWEMKRDFLSPAYTTRLEDVPKVM
jgi:hypothetical protein